MPDLLDRYEEMVRPEPEPERLERGLEVHERFLDPIILPADALAHLTIERMPSVTLDIGSINDIYREGRIYTDPNGGFTTTSWNGEVVYEFRGDGTILYRGREILSVRPT